MEQRNNQGVALLAQGRASQALGAFIQAMHQAKAASCSSPHERLPMVEDTGKGLLEWNDVAAVFDCRCSQENPASAIPLDDQRMYSHHTRVDLEIRSSIIIFNLGLCFHRMSGSHQQGKARSLYIHALCLLQPSATTTTHHHADTTRCFMDLLSVMILNNLQALTPTDNISQDDSIMDWFYRTLPERSYWAIMPWTAKRRLQGVLRNLLLHWTIQSILSTKVAAAA